LRHGFEHRAGQLGGSARYLSAPVDHGVPDHPLPVKRRRPSPYEPRS
jgi:hypothetical protein